MFLGTQANSLNFQLYLLEGLNRWNQNRTEASVSGKPSSFLTYSGALLQCINTSSVKVLGRKYITTFHPPAQYTGKSNSNLFLITVHNETLVLCNKREDALHYIKINMNGSRFFTVILLHA